MTKELEAKTTSPRLNSAVWIKYGNIRQGYCFIKVTVIAKGTDIFIHSGCIDYCKVEDFRVPVKYEDYKQVWFKSLKEIKDQYKIKKVTEDYYEGEIKNEKWI